MASVVSKRRFRWFVRTDNELLRISDTLQKFERNEMNLRDIYSNNYVTITTTIPGVVACVCTSPWIRTINHRRKGLFVFEHGIRRLQGHRASYQSAPASGIGKTAHQEAVPRRENAGCDSQQSQPARAETGRDHGDCTWQDAAHGECFVDLYTYACRLKAIIFAERSFSFIIEAFARAYVRRVYIHLWALLKIYIFLNILYIWIYVEFTFKIL